MTGSVWADVRDIPLNLDAPTEGLAPPDPSSLIPIREPVDAAPGSIALALGRADASAITAMDVGHGSPDSSPVTLTGKVVTATRGEFPNHIYCEEPNRSAGIRVKWSGAYKPARGDVVDVSGVVGTASDGERVIDADTGTPHGVTFVQTGTPLTPLGMVNRAIGGGPFGPYSPGVDGGVGLFNKGLLVKTTGRVSSVDEPNKLFYITDGSLPDALKVSWDWPAGRPSIVPPQVGWKVGVTGLASSEVSGGSMLRVLRPRNQSDLGVYEPEDTTDPTIEITSPKGTTWHRASGITSIVVSGTAEDAETCITKVEAKSGSNPWEAASYNPTTKTWQFTWIVPFSTRLIVRATDFAGNQDSTYADVTIASSVPVIYVNCARPDNSGNGQTWATAEKTIQAGIDSALGGYDVWVAAGAYLDTVGHKTGVGLYGGFVGTETVREQRDWAINTTTIDCNHVTGPVVTIPSEAGLSTVLDGFTIQNALYYGGIYCMGSANIAHNLVRNNDGNYAGTVSAGGLTVFGSPTVVGNVFVGNIGGGVRYHAYSGGQLTNNTIINNSGAPNGGGVDIAYASPVLTNNIVAWNRQGGIARSGGTQTFANNDVYGNEGYNYNWSPPPAADIQLDPGIWYRDQGDWHIWWGSPCKDAGSDSVVLPDGFDIDAEARRNGPIDIGADEASECWRYTIGLTSETYTTWVSTPVKVTAYIYDTTANQPASGYQVDISVDAGEIISVTRNGSTVTLPSGTESTCGVTGADGEVEAYVTRQDGGYVRVNGTITQCDDPIDKTVSIWFNPFPIVNPTRWQTVSVHDSCPLVADLIPGDSGANEVAVIAYRHLSGSSWVSDGGAYVWRADGTLAWTSRKRDGTALQIDAYGNNTLSAADIDQRPENQNLEMIAPLRSSTNVYAFGYDTSASRFKPVAGWPVTTQYQFEGVAAAIGDANLDGTRETVAGDLSCYVFSWSPAGGSYLWRQLTGTSGTSIDYSSVALGDVDHFADTGRIPDAVVGSHWSSGPLFAFCGDSWGTSAIYPSGSTWPKSGDENMDCSPAIGLIDGDSDNDFAVGCNSGRLYVWLSATQTWTYYQLAASTDSDKFIRSAPVIAELNDQRCVVVGCNNGRVYAIKSDGTPIAGWPADGIYVSIEGTGFKVVASPAVADVMNTGSPQIVVACTDGNVYALWPDGNNNMNGPIAKVWVCAQPDSTGVEVDSTPAICSLNGTQVSMIIGSTDGIYKADLYSLQQGETFVPNSARWPWPTFHRDNARTGCQTADSMTIPWWTPAPLVSASIAGKITLNGNPVQGAKIYIKVLPGLTLPGVYGRSGAERTDPERSSGDATSSTDEFDEGQYCLSQLPPNHTYRITVTDASGGHSTTPPDVEVTTGRIVLDVQLTP